MLAVRLQRLAVLTGLFCAGGCSGRAALLSPSATASVGGFAVAGTVTEIGGGPLAGATVTIVATGESTLTGQEGAYRLRAAGNTSLDFSKADYEPQRLGDFALAGDTTVNAHLQPMIVLGPTSHRSMVLLAEDQFYPISGTEICGPCKVIRIAVNAPSDVNIGVRSSESVLIGLWFDGGSASGSPSAEATLHLPAGSSRIYVGVKRSLRAGLTTGTSVPLDITTQPHVTP